MKIWTSEYIFDHPWETVVKAAWRKYPNPMNPHVIGTDVIDRKVTNGVLHSHRLMSSGNFGLPVWIQKLIGCPRVFYAQEYSQVDPRIRRMSMKSRNLTFGSTISVDESLSYSPHPEDSTKTLLKQEAIVTVEGVPLSDYMESLLTSTIDTNAFKGRQAIEWVIDKINEEVIELRNSAVKSTDEFLNQTRKSTDDFLNQTRKSLDDISLVAKKSLDGLHLIQPPPSNRSSPKF